MEEQDDVTHRFSPEFVPILTSADESGGAFTESIRDANGHASLVALVAWRTCRGLIRDENEDACLAGIAPGAGGLMLAVFDGIGGHPGGRLASQTAAETFAEERSTFAPGDELGAWLQQMMARANEDVRECGRDEQMPGMGTTATVLVARDGRVLVGHAGDTRAYRLRDKKLKLLTRDHTMVQALVSAGKTPTEAQESGWGSVILSALGIDETVPTIDVAESDLASGDVLLLSTDGLHGVVPDHRIEQILAERGNPSEVARRLMREAYEKASADNITIVIARIQGAP